MKVLVVGNGGREHAIAWRLRKSPLIEHVYVAPGNAGTLREPKVDNVPISPLDFPALVEFVKRENIEFTIVGPEAPLVAGIVDVFQAEGLRCLGPSKAAAQLEASKNFTKEFLIRHNIPTAQSKTFTDFETAKKYIESKTAPIVIKADGLAGGKGVVVAQSTSEAILAAQSMLSHHSLGTAGNQILVEDFLQGEEASFIVITDGTNVIPLATSQDHKARDDGDQGPNTGGMGAYSPAPVITEELHERIMNEVMIPTIKGMEAEGHPFVGFLYAGLMIDEKGNFNVLEFNCRFGDPETEPVLMRLKSDFAEMCLCALDKCLNIYAPIWDPKVSLGVVLASHGYPNEVEVGKTIEGLNMPIAKGEKIFHAATKLEEGKIITTGGRVLCVTTKADTIKEAHAKAYAVIKKINWDGMFYRTDIGYRAMIRELD